MKTIMIAFREGSENGGPYNSHLRIMNSRLNNRFRFVPLIVPKGKMGIINHRITQNLVNQINAVKPDAVQIIGLELIGYHLVKACKCAGVKKIIIAIHGSTTEAIEFNKNPIKKFIMEWLEVYTLKAGYCTYGVSNYVSTIKNVKKNSKNYYGSIYNLMLDTPELVNRERSRMTFGLTENQIVIISTGRLVKEKGFDVLTKVIKHYENNDRLVFIIAGDGEYRSQMEFELKTQIDMNRVLLLGYRSDISNILAAGDIFVMPSYHETLCMSLLEAGQRGLAMIASNVGGMKEIVSDNCDGYLCESGSEESFIEKIDTLLRDAALLSRMRRLAEKNVNSKFSNTVTLSKLEQMYNSVLGE